MSSIEKGTEERSFPWIIFDMDGTLVDTFQLNLSSFNYAVDGFLKKTLTTDEILGMLGGTLEEQLTNYVPRGAVPRAIERFHAHYIHHCNEARLFPGIRRILLTLHARGVKLAVCTGAGKQVADYTLARSGLSQFFTTVVTADDVSKPKPNPEGLRMVMETIRAHSDQTVYVGDHPNDIEASRNAGVRTAAACWGSKHRRELYDLRPDFLLKHPSEVLLHFH